MSDERRKRQRTANMTVAALGVVFGDIGTSPLYAVRECFAHGLTPTPGHVLGVLSLLMWSIILVVGVKYVGLVLRADNRGEGGVLALMALAQRSVGDLPRLSRALTAIGLVGAALFFGDAIITPSISVLSAVEGVQVAMPHLSEWVIPISVAILTALFAVQRHGTRTVGALFGPAMIVWFVVIGGLGAVSVARNPDILRALLPGHALGLMLEDPVRAFALLGAAVLVLTGAEALYADMGHFNRRSIRSAWFTVAMPALVLNYLGQGALLMQNPDALDNPFYRLAPESAQVPLIVLAAGATVIASQAVISGAYSIVRQAILLRYWPRMEICHTSSEDAGQIYLPALNWEMLAAILVLVLGFRSSSNLAGAYGLAVSGTMISTGIMLLIVARRAWHWSWPAVVAVGVPMAVIDVAFFTSNVLKIPSGGWLPVCAALLFVAIMTTWRRGKRQVAWRLRHEVIPLEDFVRDSRVVGPRTAGTAIFLASIPEIVPPALMHNLEHNGVLHERNIIVAVASENLAYVRKDGRCRVQHLGDEFYRVWLRFGFMEAQDVPAAMERFCPELLAGRRRISYFIGRENVRAGGERGRPSWRERLFVALARNAADATNFFHLPPDRVVEIGVQVEI